MTDSRKNSELIERRQVSARISHLRSDCEKLVTLKDSLTSRLNELNEITDKLLDEMQTNLHRADLAVSPPSDKNTAAKAFISSKPIGRTVSCDQNMPTLPNDLANIHDRPNISRFATSSRQLVQKSFQKQSRHSTPSNAYRYRLAKYLDEVLQKAEELNRLSDHLSGERSCR